MIDITPYIEINGSRTFTDMFLTSIYRKMCHDKTLQSTFLYGTIRNELEFISFCKRSDIRLWFITYEKQELGFFWLDTFSGHACNIHFCTFSEYWGDVLLVTAGYQVFKTLFNMRDTNGNTLFPVLIGEISTKNEYAIEYTKKVGMVEVGVVPKALWNGWEMKPEDKYICYKKGE